MTAQVIDFWTRRAMQPRDEVWAWALVWVPGVWVPIWRLVKV